MSRETDIAWCAGLFDGEGHVSYRRSYPSEKHNTVSAMLHANVPQKSDNIEVLHEFQRIIGFGKLKGPYRTRTGPKHVVIYGTKTVEKLFLMLKPYLKSKKTQDFQTALMAYMAHDHKATVADHERAIKRLMNKARKST